MSGSDAREKENEGSSGKRGMFLMAQGHPSPMPMAHTFLIPLVFNH